MPDRDRNEAGRAESARLRDPKTGRPLPRDARPRGGRRAALEAADRATALPPEEALAEAERLILDGRPFFAHEVLEGPWHLADEPMRDFWQGLAQVAVGLTHLQRGNAVGAAALLRSGAERLSGYPDGLLGVAVTSVETAARSLAARVDAEGVANIADADLRLPLLVPGEGSASDQARY